MRLQYRRVAITLLILLALMAAPLEAAMEVKSVTVTEVEPDSLLLDAGLDIQLPATIKEAIDNGVGIQILFEVQLMHKKRYVPNPQLGGLQYKFEIKYHALSEQYVVTTLQPLDRNAYPDLYSALYDKKQLKSLHLIMNAPTILQSSYYLRARVRINTEALPLPLRIKSYFDKDWQMSSGWEKWPL